MNNEIPIPIGIQTGRIEFQSCANIKSPNTIPERPIPLEIQHTNINTSVTNVYRPSKITAIIPETELAAAGSIAAIHDVQHTSVINVLIESFIIFSIFVVN